MHAELPEQGFIRYGEGFIEIIHSKESVPLHGHLFRYMTYSQYVEIYKQFVVPYLTLPQQFSEIYRRSHEI